MHPICRLSRIAILCAAISGTSLFAQQEDKPAPAGVAAQQPASQPADVPVRMVVLYSSGVGYFEHHGTVEGTTSTELRFKTEQINDLLKSLVLQDLDKGQVTAITYPSLDPLSKLLKSFQVDVSGNLSRSDLLKQLRGAKVTCQKGDGKSITGTILGVEVEKIPTGEKGDLQEIPVLNLLNENGITNIQLPTVQFVSFEDKRLQEELNKALAALAQARDQDKKSVVINFAGEGKRRVKLGYIIETPVWKTSYRLLLSDDKDSKPFIQGWAIVENQTDQDWNNIELSLVSGRPISFVQDLYQPLYVPRPVVQPELYASLKPQEYEEGMARAEDAVKQPWGSSGGMAANAPAPTAAPAPMTKGLVQARRMPAARADKEAFASSVRSQAEAAKMEALDAAGVASAASATNLGDLFEYTVGVPVSLARQKSAMLPIIADAIEAKKVSIYNAATLARNPLNGAILTNSTGKHLLQGPITVLDNGSYGGDARIQDLPPGQQRLISYGIDLKMLVDSTSTKEEDAILSGKIVKGVLQVARKHVFTQEYKAENKGQQDKTLVIEHPFRNNWKLITPEKPMEKTDTLYRFQVPAPAGKPVALKVQEEHSDWEAYAILPLDLDQLVFYARRGEIPQSVRDALNTAIQKKQALVDTQRQQEQTRQKIAEVSQAQQRTRENMNAVAKNAQGSDYYGRLVKRLEDQDSQLDTLQKQQDDLQQQFNARQKDLEDYLNNLSVG